MKRTAYLIVDAHHESGWLLSEKKITCEVYGEWDTGTKVWQDIETGELYGLLRMLGVYYFYKF